MSNRLTFEERERRDEAKRIREREYRRAQRGTGRNRDISGPVIDTSRRYVDLAELAARIRACPALAELGSGS